MNLFHFNEISLSLIIGKSSLQEKIDEALVKQLKSLESGEIVNPTENRAVDHFNLRLKNSPVKGKSYGKSLEKWYDIEKRIKDIVKEKKYENVIFNGIGGSILGPLMMMIFENGKLCNINGLNIYFLSNTDPDSFKLLVKKVDLEKTILVTMSKSGGTAETMNNYFCFNEYSKGLSKNITITTKGSKLEKISLSDKNNIGLFYMNSETGGRTSISSAIGMVPCAFCNMDFKMFLDGLEKMDTLTRKFDDIKNNPALLIASYIHDLTKEKGHKNMIVLGYSDFLKEYSHYLQQLYMESLGKEFDITNVKKVNEGQTTFGGIGTSEQHAFMQQVQKGINDCFVRFIYFLKRENDFVHKNIDCGSMGRQLLGFVKGTEYALKMNNKPYFTTVFEKRDLFNLGLMIALEERIVAFLGFLKNINAFDQKGVEFGKKSAKLMNKVSVSIEDFISKQEKDWKWEGNAEKAKETFKLSDNVPLTFIDSVLSDIYANIEVEKSFSKILGRKVSRSFLKDEFIYKIE